MTSSAALPAWALRVVWVLQPLAFVPLLDSAFSTLPNSGRLIAAAIAWATWAVVLLASLVPSTVSITVGRLLAPLLPVVAVVTGFAGSVSGVQLAVALGAGVVAVLV